MKEFELKYGCNPNQKPAKIFMHDGSDLPIEILCGRPGYINFLDAFNSWQLVKELNERKAKILYDFLDSSEMFKGTVVPEDRSLMNVPFVTGDTDLDTKFVAAAKEAGFINIKGHRTVGGMRASIYNAMPIEGVEKLVAFMKKFEEENK